MAKYDKKEVKVNLMKKTVSEYVDFDLLEQFINSLADLKAGRFRRVK